MARPANSRGYLEAHAATVDRELRAAHGQAEWRVDGAASVRGMKNEGICWGRATARLEDKKMLFFVFLLLVLWFSGLVTSYTLGGLLHILLVIAIVLFLVHLIQGRSIGEA